MTIDDVLDIAEEVATREIQQFGGLEALDEPYVATPILAMVRKRASWLVVLFLGEMLTATAMGFFEAEMARAVVLALFRSIDHLERRQLGFASRHAHHPGAGRWARSNCPTGASPGPRVGVRTHAGGHPRGRSGSSGSPLEALSRASTARTGSDRPHGVLSLVGIVLWGTLSASMLPFVLKRLGFDPATSARLRLSPRWLT